MSLPVQALAVAAAISCGAMQFAHADDAGLLRCRAVVDAGARLSCYDALAAGAAQRPGAPAAARPQGTATTAPATQGTPAAATAAAGPQTSFGLPTAPGAEVQHIESHIVGAFNGWTANQQITLANGQVWRIADGSQAFFEVNNPKVRVERGTMSAFYMVIAGTNRSPRVRRVR